MKCRRGGTWTALFQSYRIPCSGAGVERLIEAARHELAWGFAEDNAKQYHALRAVVRHERELLVRHVRFLLRLSGGCSG